MFFLSDGTLTTSNVCQALASVKDWHSLGCKYTGGLDVPGAVCDDIRDNRPNKTDEEKKTEMLVYYLHTMPQASWQTIAGVLYYREEVTALEAVKRFLHHTPGQLTHDTQLSIITSCIYMYTYMPNYTNLGQGQHVFLLPLSTIPQMYNVNTCPIGFSLPVSIIIVSIYIIYTYIDIQK